MSEVLLLIFNSAGSFSTTMDGAYARTRATAQDRLDPFTLHSPPLRHDAPSGAVSAAAEEKSLPSCRSFRCLWIHLSAFWLQGSPVSSIISLSLH